jgi:tetratricopeptide (TPR) repeat protein
LHLLGLVTLAHGRAADAAALIGRAVKGEPKSVLFLVSLANAQAAAGQRSRAIANLKRALKANPRAAEAWNALGVLYANGDEPLRARHAFRKAVGLRPEFAECWNNLGLALAATGELEDARRALETGHAAAPDYPVLLNSLGAVVRELGEIETSITHLEAAVARNPRYFEALTNLGGALAEAHRYDDAIERLETALGLDPLNAEAWRALAKPLAALGESERALAACDRASQLVPDDPIPRWERALVALAAGRFKSGWDDYRFRHMVDRGHWPVPAAPLPDGLAGRKLVIVSEQGLGEELFFLRIAPALAARGAHIAAWTDPRLTAMAARIEGIAEVLPRDGPPPEGEQVLMGDLPYLAQIGDQTPPPVAIAPLTEKIREVRARLEASDEGPWLAITWRAGIAGRETLHKEAPLDLLAAPAANWPGAILALQRNACTGEIAALTAKLGKPVHDFTDLNDDLEGMLALMAVIDAYAGVSNTNMHLAAAAKAAGAAIDCHVLVPAPAEFRWRARGAHSPWFPGFTIHREDPREGWGAARDGLVRAFATGG